MPLTQMAMKIKWRKTRCSGVEVLFEVLKRGYVYGFWAGEIKIRVFLNSFWDIDFQDSGCLEDRIWDIGFEILTVQLSGKRIQDIKL